MPLLLGIIFGRDGFLGTRGSFLIDVVFVALIALLPVMAWSIWSVRYRKRYQLHKRLQLAQGELLLIAVVLFELEMRLIGWQHRAMDSRFWQDGAWNDLIDCTLAIHLVFAIPTPLIWIAVIWMALRRFPKPPGPAEHSRQHIRWARCAALGMVATAVTGWIFYWCAFVA